MTLPTCIHTSRLRVWPFVVALVVVWLLAVAILDTPLARWSIDTSWLRFLVGTLTVAETFGHGTGVLLIAITVWVLDDRRRTLVPWMLAGAWSGGIAANVAKFVVARMRPRAWLELTDNHSQRAIDTFVGWLPLGSGGSAEQSFPSAHTATAFGLAVMLSQMYPRGQRWFYVLATLVAVQRVTSHAHFPSDVLAGGVVGWLVAHLVAQRMPVLDNEARQFANS